MRRRGCCVHRIILALGIGSWAQWSMRTLNAADGAAFLQDLSCTLGRTKSIKGQRQEHLSWGHPVAQNPQIYFFNEIQATPLWVRFDEAFTLLLIRLPAGGQLVACWVPKLGPTELFETYITESASAWTKRHTSGVWTFHLERKGREPQLKRGFSRIPPSWANGF